MTAGKEHIYEAPIPSEDEHPKKKTYEPSRAGNFIRRGNAFVRLLASLILVPSEHAANPGPAQACNTRGWGV
jgi:hypothetical protein